MNDPVLDAVAGAGLPPGSRLLVAVSGGADSVALLHALKRTASEHQWELRVGHVNHGLRGAESVADEEFVRRLAQAEGIPIDVATVDVRGHARRDRHSLEAAARLLRYRALRDMLAQWPGTFIVTAHTLDDQAETVIMRLLRGTGLAGLGAMRVRGEDIVRPLLPVPREEVILYLQRHRLPYRLDSSNRERRFRRNRIRQEVMPALEHEAPGAAARLARTAFLLQADAEYLAAEAGEALNLLEGRRQGAVSLAGWQALHPSLRRGALRMLVERATGQPGAVGSDAVLAIEAGLLSADARTSRAWPLTGTARLEVHAGELRVSRPVRAAAPWAAVRIRLPGETRVPVGKLTAEELSADPQTVEQLIAALGPWHALLGADALGAELWLRTRRPGERMRPLAGPGLRKVQDIMVDARIPARLRQSWPLVTCGDDVIWIPGVARGETMRIAPGARSIVHLSFRPAPGVQHARILRHFERI